MNSSNVTILVCGCVFAFFTFVDSLKGSPFIKIFVFFVTLFSTIAPKSVNCFVNSFFVNDGVDDVQDDDSLSSSEKKIIKREEKQEQAVVDNRTQGDRTNKSINHILSYTKMK